MTCTRLHIPLAHREIPMRGTVVATGPDSHLTIGDRVLISRYAGNEFKFTREDENNYGVHRDNEVIMVIEDGGV